MISKEPIKNRIARGMTPEQAETMPLQWKRKLTKEKVLEIEAHGLSITSSAFLLNVKFPSHDKSSNCRENTCPECNDQYLDKIVTGKLNITRIYQA